MKLYFEDKKGYKHEVEKVVGLQQGDIVLFARPCFREETIKSLEVYMSERFGRKVILLDGRFSDVVVVPPCSRCVWLTSSDRQPRMI